MLYKGDIMKKLKDCKSEHVVNITLNESGKKRIEELIIQGKTESEVREILYSDISKCVEIKNIALGK